MVRAGRTVSAGAARSMAIRGGCARRKGGIMTTRPGAEPAPNRKLRMTKAGWVLLVVAGGALCLGLIVPAHAATYATIDVSGATGTFGKTIDAAGDVAGGWYDSGGVAHGFLRTANGTITTFDPPGSTGTTVMTINDSQEIAGFFTDSQGTHGFLRTANGTITVYDAPQSDGYTQILSLNDKNAFTGDYVLTDQDSDGFVVNGHGKFKSFAPTGSFYAYSSAINAQEITAGIYYDGSLYHGFVRTTKGKITAFDVPGGNSLFVYGINAKKSVVGTSYENDVSATGQGYIRSSKGTFATFQVVPGYETDGYGINAKGYVCGDYYDNTGAYHGYIRDPNGTVVSFDPPAAVVTTATGINDSSALTGYYFDSQDIQHGFLRTP
jgi:hypothetical protein